MTENDTKETQRDFPVNEMEKIQEALKPLGYIVYGYKKKQRPERSILHLKYNYPFIQISSSSDIPN